MVGTGLELVKSKEILCRKDKYSASEMLNPQLDVDSSRLGSPSSPCETDTSP